MELQVHFTDLITTQWGGFSSAPSFFSFLHPLVDPGSQVSLGIQVVGVLFALTVLLETSGFDASLVTLHLDFKLYFVQWERQKGSHRGFEEYPRI